MVFHKRSRLRRAAVNVTIIATVTLVLSEITLGIYQRIFPTFIFYDDSYDRFRPPPSSYDYDFQLNSAGFKDLEFAADKGGRYRILGIGDSFAFGAVPYEQNYLTLLETQLQDRVPEVEVLNMGIPAIQPEHYLDLLVTEGLPLEPDMVLVSFFTGNDIDKPLLPRAEDWHKFSYTASLLRFAFFIYPQLQRHREAQKQIQQQRRYEDDSPHGRTEDEYIRIERKRSHIYVTGWPGFLPRLTSAMEYLREIRDVCRRYDMPFAVIIVPDELQVNPELQADVIRLRQASGEAWENMDFTMPNRELSLRLAEAGIPTLDLTDRFIELSRETRLYKPRDTHWNIAGNLEATNQIRNFFLENFLGDQGD